MPLLTKEKLDEQISTKVSPSMKKWIEEQAASPFFHSEGSVVRAALAAMQKRGAVETLEELHDD